MFYSKLMVAHLLCVRRGETQPQAPETQNTTNYKTQQEAWDQSARESRITDRGDLALSGEATIGP